MSSKYVINGEMLVKIPAVSVICNQLGAHSVDQELIHYNDVMVSTLASQITNLAIVYATIYSRRRSKKTPKLRVTGLFCGEFTGQRASNAENVFIWWRHLDVARSGKAMFATNRIIKCLFYVSLISYIYQIYDYNVKMLCFASRLVVWLNHMFVSFRW